MKILIIKDRKKQETWGRNNIYFSKSFFFLINLYHFNFKKGYYLPLYQFSVVLLMIVLPCLADNGL